MIDYWSGFQKSQTALTCQNRAEKWEGPSEEPSLFFFFCFPSSFFCWLCTFFILTNCPKFQEYCCMIPFWENEAKFEKKIFFFKSESKFKKNLYFFIIILLKNVIIILAKKLGHFARFSWFSLTQVFLTKITGQKYLNFTWKGWNWCSVMASVYDFPCCYRGSPRQWSQVSKKYERTSEDFDLKIIVPSAGLSQI